jgi:pimeloyl-ACP methyl ester carboxylesterase
VNHPISSGSKLFTVLARLRRRDRTFPYELFCLLCIIALLIAATVSGQGVPLPEAVQVEAEDGLLLSGDFYAAGPDTAPAVLLLHMVDSDRSAWIDFIPSLTGSGYHTLNVDLRGYGASGAAADWTAAQDDVLRWYTWMEEQPLIADEGYGVIGASVGATLALVSCPEKAACKTVVARAPGLDYYSIMPETALVEGFGSRSALLVTSQLDRPSAYDTRTMAWNTPGEIGIRNYAGQAHGTDLLLVEGDSIAPLILNWLDEYLPLPERSGSATPTATATGIAPLVTATPG